MLSSIDTQSPIAQSSWQSRSLYTCHPIDLAPEIQRQYHQEHFSRPTSSSSSLLPENEETRVQDDDPTTVSRLTTSHLAPLVDLHMHFQDLPSFIHHPDFDHFAFCWMESQYYIGLSKRVECRPTAMAWFASSAVQLASIASNYSPIFAPNEGCEEASTPHIKAAYQRLVHYFNVMHKVISTIEHGRLINRTPQEVMLPIYNQLLEKSFRQQNQQFHHQNGAAPAPAALGYESPSSSLVPMSMSDPPYLNHSDASSLQAQPMSLEFPPNHQHLLPHEYLSLSSPVTPNGIDSLSALFWTYPVSTQHQQQQQQQQPNQASSISSFDSLSASPADTIKDEEEGSETISTIAPMQLDHYHHYQTHDFEGSTAEDQDSDYQQNSIEDEEDEDDDYDYGEEDGDGMDRRTRPKKRNGATTANNSSTSTNIHQAHWRKQRVESKDKATATTATPRYSFPRRGRTATSYDDETTHFLKTMFFNIYSQRDKLTKEQRRQVVEKTGLKPRNVTYWFSNHKRRFQTALDVFKKLVAESNGRIQTYDDFIQWRRDHGLPEDITDTRT